METVVWKGIQEERMMYNTPQGSVRIFGWTLNRSSSCQKEENGSPSSDKKFMFSLSSDSPAPPAWHESSKDGRLLIWRKEERTFRPSSVQHIRTSSHISMVVQSIYGRSGRTPLLMSVSLLRMCEFFNACLVLYLQKTEEKKSEIKNIQREENSRFGGRRKRYTWSSVTSKNRSRYPSPLW